MQKLLNIADFRSLTKETFDLQLKGTDVAELELVEVNDLGPRPGPGRERAFSLIFSGALAGPERNMYLRQGTYRMTHREIGALDIFIVPVGRGDRGMRYEAVFN